jgi:glutathione S-transferase
MLTLYHAPESRSSRILWLLEELKADYQIVYVDIPRMNGSGAPDPRNPHPDKKVPALLHDGRLITESMAVTLYLTDLFPGASLAPQTGDPKRGEYLTWLFYYAGVIEPVLHAEFAGLSDNQMLYRTFRGRAELDRRILTALKDKPYFLGESFSAVDVIMASLGLFFRQALPKDDLVDAYLERCSSRPALKAALARDAPPTG